VEKPMRRKKSIFKIIFDLCSWLFLIVFTVVVIFTIGSNTNLIAGYRSFLVQSGSMEPTIMAGDIVLVHSQPQYLINDTVTFFGSDGRIVTHRIIKSSQEGEKIVFATKGDANRSVDSDVTTLDKIIGKVILVIPKLGYFVAFSKSLPGLIILIFVPTFFLILDELLKLKGNAQRQN
jgi:signal peptidase